MRAISDSHLRVQSQGTVGRRHMPEKGLPEKERKEKKCSDELRETRRETGPLIKIKNLMRTRLKIKGKKVVAMRACAIDGIEEGGREKTLFKVAKENIKQRSMNPAAGQKKDAGSNPPRLRRS